MSRRPQVHVHLQRVVADRAALDALGSDGVAAVVAAQVGPRLPDAPRDAAPSGLEGQISAAIAAELRGRREPR